MQSTPLPNPNDAPANSSALPSALADKVITSLLKDHLGYLWIGTDLGLFRYDGYYLETYRHDPKNPHSLSNNFITALSEDALGNLWVGTHSGLNVYFRKEDRFRLVRTLRVQALFTQKDTVWASLNEATLLKIHFKASKDSVVYIDEEILSPLQVISFAQDLKGSLLLGTLQGFAFLYHPSENPPFSYPVSAILPASGNKVWLGTQGNGLFLYDLSTHTYRQVYFCKKQWEEGKNFITHIVNGPQETLWIGTRQGLLQGKMNPEGREFIFSEYPIPNLRVSGSQEVLALLAAEKAYLWAGTSYGLARILSRPSSISFHQIEINHHILPNQQVKALFQDEEENLLIGTAQHGLFRWDLSTHEYEKIEIPGNNVYQIGKLGDQTLWIAADNRLLTYDVKRKHSKIQFQSKSNITSFLSVKGYGLWIGQWKDGVKILDLHPEQASFLTTVTDSLKEKHVFCMLQDQRGEVWIGTRGQGLYRINLKNKTLQHLTSPGHPQMTSNGILCLKEDSQGNIWVGTNTGGLLRFDHHPIRNITSWGLQDGLPSYAVCGIEEGARGQMWISTRKGMVQYLPQQPHPFARLTEEDGIGFQQFSFHASASGFGHRELYFGSLGGFYQIFSHKYPDTAAFPTLLVRLMEPSRKPTSASFLPKFSEVKPQLAYDHNDVYFHFAAIQPETPQKIRYAYRLEGYQDTWTYVDADTRQVYYENLPPGPYTFHVRASNALGQWDGREAVQALVISPPPWFIKIQPFWPWLLGLLGTFMAFWIGKSTYSKKSRMKSKLMSDITHEMRNRLTLILGSLETAHQDHEQMLAQETLKDIYRNAWRLKKLTDRLLEDRHDSDKGLELHVRQGNISGFMKEIYEEYRKAAHVQQITYNFCSSSQHVSAYFDQEILEIILHNLLSNAFKFTPAGGCVKILVEQADHLPQGIAGTNPHRQDKFIQCQISDTGVGIPEKEIQVIFERYYRARDTRPDIPGHGIGLEMVARLVKLHHGYLLVESQPRQGTTFTFWLPQHASHYDTLERDVEAPSLLNTIPSFHKITDAKNQELPLVLVAEDDPEIQCLIKNILRDAFRVSLSSDGEEAMKLIRENRPHIILSDLYMPHQDGLAFLQNVRTDAEFSHLPFVILTGQHSEANKLACIRLGADDYIEKPFSAVYLKWRLSKLIGMRAQLEEKYRQYAMIPDELVPEGQDDRFVDDLNKLIEDHLDNPSLNVDFLASEIGMSRATLYRKMESVFQSSPHQFIKKYRLKRAAQLLQLRKHNVSEISYHIGFGNPKYFSKCFLQEFGCTPTAFVKSSKNEITS